MNDPSQHSMDFPATVHDIDDCWNKTGVYGPIQDRCQRLASLLHCRNCQKYINTGRLLLNRDLDEEYRRELTKIFSREKTESPKEITAVFSFKAGREWLAIGASVIEEIVEMGMIHSIPHRSNKTLRGVVSVRGKLELCFSIGGILGIERNVSQEKSRYRSPERLVVASNKGFRIVFPVTEVMGIIRFSPEMVQEVPVTVSHAKAAFTNGILPFKQMDIGLLNETVLFAELKKNLS